MSNPQIKENQQYLDPDKPALLNMHCILTGLAWPKKRDLICNFEQHGWIKTPAYTHTRRHCCSCFSLHVCQTSFSVVHTLQTSWPLIYCILAPNIECWPLVCAGQEMQVGKNRRRVKKKSENNWQASRLMGTALIIMSSLQVSEPAAFWGEVWLPKKQTKRNSFTGIKKAREGG